jgi:hypothetical protein
VEDNNFVAIVAIDRRERHVHEVVVVLLHEPRDLGGERFLFGRTRDAGELRRGFVRDPGDVLVVLEMRAIPLDDRVGLVDVLLSQEDRDLVTGVLGVIELGFFPIRAFQLRYRVEYGHECEREEPEHDGERQAEARAGAGSRYETARDDKTHAGGTF